MKNKIKFFIHYEKEWNYIALRIDFDNFLVALKHGNKNRTDYYYKKLTNDVLLIAKGHKPSIDKKVK